MRSSLLSVRFSWATLGCFAAWQPVQAQQAEFLFTGGGLLSNSNFSLASGNPTLNSLFSLKSGVLFAQKWGLGLFYERTNLTSEVTHSVPNHPSKLYYSYEVTVADPQHSLGLEAYRKVALTPKTHLRFGALLGYAWAGFICLRSLVEFPKRVGQVSPADLMPTLCFPSGTAFPELPAQGSEFRISGMKCTPSKPKSPRLASPFLLV